MPSEAVPERIVWKQLNDGDYRKFVAESNDSRTGGGARDLRFRHFDEFEPILGQMFPGRSPNQGPRGVEVFTGTIAWKEGASTRRMEGKIWPPTTVRPNEGRLATVDMYKPFSDAQRFPGEYELVVLVHDSDNEVWPYVIGHTQLEEWDDEVAEAIRHCLFQGERSDRTLAAGYIDLLSGRKECVV